MIAEGERDRTTARAGGGGRDASSAGPTAEREESAAFAAYLKPAIRAGPAGSSDQTPFPRLPSPACSVSVSAARLGGLVAATLARASLARRLSKKDDSRLALSARRALRVEAETTERAACDVLEYWRASLPALRGPGVPDAAAAIAAGGPAAAATFRNDAYFLASRFSAAAYAFGFGSDVAETTVSDDCSELDSNPDEPEKSTGTHPNLMWVVPPLLRLGDAVLDATTREASREISANVSEFSRLFARGLARRGDAEEATRALRRARRCLGSAIGAFEAALPEPVSTKRAAELLLRYARETLAGVFAATDGVFSRDARDAARDAVREAFSSAGVFVFASSASGAGGATTNPTTNVTDDVPHAGGSTSAGSGSSFYSSVAARRAAAAAAFDAILARVGAASSWRKGAAVGVFFEASLGDVDAGLSDGRWARLGFEPGEIRSVVCAVFEDSQRRRAVLERLA